jgi:hypothetical protein
LLRGSRYGFLLALLTVPDDAIPGLVAERAALRAELRQLSENAMVRLDNETRKPPDLHDG